MICCFLIKKDWLISILKAEYEKDICVVVSKILSVGFNDTSHGSCAQNIVFEDPVGTKMYL
jgi:hypothetical protein